MPLIFKWEFYNYSNFLTIIFIFSELFTINYIFKDQSGKFQKDTK